MPHIAKASDVVDVYLDVLDEGKEAFHNLLGDVRRCGDAHGETMVAVQAKWGGDSAKFFAFVVQFEGIVLHCNRCGVKECPEYEGSGRPCT